MVWKKRPKKYKSPIVGHYTNEEWEKLIDEQKSSAKEKAKIQSERSRELHAARNEKETLRIDKGRVIRRPSRTVVR